MRIACVLTVRKKSREEAVVIAARCHLRQHRPKSAGKPSKKQSENRTVSVTFTASSPLFSSTCSRKQSLSTIPEGLVVAEVRVHSPRRMNHQRADEPRSPCVIIHRFSPKQTDNDEFHTEIQWRVSILTTRQHSVPAIPAHTLHPHATSHSRHSSIESWWLAG